MNRPSTLYAPLVGRILVGGFFLWGGIQEILNLPFVVSMLALAGLPHPLFLAAVVRILGGIALVINYKTQVCALVLIGYELASSFMLFADLTPSHLQLFLQSMAIIGGLLYMASCNPFGPANQAAQKKK